MDAGSLPSPPPPPSPPLRIMIVPWLAFGHLLPYLELAERLASRGHHVSFVTTPRNAARLPPLRPAAAPRVNLVALPLPRVDGGLPDGAESTNDIPHELLWEAFDGLAAPFADFFAAACAGEGRKPDWLVVDSFHHWAPAVALQHKVPCATLLPSAAWIAEWLSPRAAAAAGSVFEQPIEERPAAMPRYEWERKARFFTDHVASGMSVARRCSLALEGCTIAAMRSCPEWEPDSFPLAAACLGKPVVPLGLLPPPPDGGRRAADAGTEEDATVRWLDAQPASSVVYVALGSEVPLAAEQVQELALGLELAGARFLWALRKPRGFLDADVLPPGFRERTHGRGVVTTGWVPQISILAHAAVGAFLTHCGRNSLVEGLLFGHPLVMLPIAGDQGPNARAMERKKVGLQVPRDDGDGSFDRHGIASVVRAVMLEETRSVFVANAMKLEEIVADKELHERYIDEFIQKLRSYATDANSTAAT
ncbi:hypothetical protein ACP4OV_008721 [Aristida adscensionis]